MSPEQALDTKAADARAAIYALGCSLFYLPTGKATYDGDTLMKKLVAHREDPIPSLRTIRAEVPERLETAFKKMVANLTPLNGLPLSCLLIYNTEASDLSALTNMKLEEISFTRKNIIQGIDVRQ